MNQDDGGQFANLKPAELERLDTLVSEYLLFRSFKQTQQQLFLDKRSPAAKLKGDDSGARNQRAIIQRILNALDSGDYPRTLTLWDTYIAQKIGTVKSTVLNAEARDAEFLVNLSCAIYPFRSNVIQTAGSPDVAAKVAARSMTMFKHYAETRGARLVQKGEEFAPFKNLFKIPFPPTHPQFKHMFGEEWYTTSRERIIFFLEKFFAPDDEPVLCQLYQKINSRSEGELKSVFRRRERKLLRFARSIFTLSNDLLSALEEGKRPEKSFLASFRNRFNSFQEVLQPDGAFDDDMTDKEQHTESPHGSPSSHSSPQKPLFKSPPRRTEGGSPSVHIDEEEADPSLSMLAFKVKQKFDGKMLEYDVISKDLVFVMHQVGDEVEALITRGNALSSADAAVVCQASMQGAVLLQGLVQSILRQDREFQPESDRKTAVLALSHADIFGLRKALRGDFVSEIGSDGISLESRSITRFLSLLATGLRRIPPFQVEKSVDGVPPRLPPYERLLTAAEIVAEYLCRLVTAIGTSPVGLKYLHTSGVHLTIALTSFLLALPLPVFNPKLNIYELGEESERAPARPRSGNGISAWCLMALITLVNDCKSHQLVIVKNGGVVWLSKAMSYFIRDLHEQMREEEENGGPPISLAQTNPDRISRSTSSAGLFEMSLYLLCIVLNNVDAQRMLVSSLSLQRETESMFSALLLLCIKTGIAEDHMEIIVSIMNVLLLEVTTREAVREMRELQVLKSGIADGVQMSISENAGQSLVDMIASDAYDPTVASLLRTEEIMISVLATQTRLSENSILNRYIGGAVSGVAFLMRYSKRGSAPLPLFNDKWEPESRPFDSPHRDGAKFNDTINVHNSPISPIPPKDMKKNSEMRSRPRILRTPNGSQIPTNEDHGMELPEEQLNNNVTFKDDADVGDRAQDGEEMDDEDEGGEDTDDNAEEGEEEEEDGGGEDDEEEDDE